MKVVPPWVIRAENPKHPPDLLVRITTLSAALAMADEALADLIRPFNLITDSSLRGYPDTPQPQAILKARAAREAIRKAREGTNEQN